LEAQRFGSQASQRFGSQASDTKKSHPRGGCLGILFEHINEVLGQFSYFSTWISFGFPVFGCFTCHLKHNMLQLHLLVDFGKAILEEKGWQFAM